MTAAIHVDFNRRDDDDNLIAAVRRLDALPHPGDIVGVRDDEDNRALARVLDVGERAVVLEPLWQTFAAADQPRLVPEAASSILIGAWTTATTVSYATTVTTGSAEPRASQTHWASGQAEEAVPA